MAYTRNPTWKDHPDTSTPITAAKLENIESGLETAASIADTAQAGLAGKASTSHTHVASDVTDFNSAVGTRAEIATLNNSFGSTGGVPIKPWESPALSAVELATVANLYSNGAFPNLVTGATSLSLTGDGTSKSTRLIINPQGGTFFRFACDLDFTAVNTGWWEVTIGWVNTGDGLHVGNKQSIIAYNSLSPKSQRIVLDIELPLGTTGAMAGLEVKISYWNNVTSGTGTVSNISLKTRTGPSRIGYWSGQTVLNDGNHSFVRYHYDVNERRWYMSSEAFGKASNTYQYTSIYGLDDLHPWNDAGVVPDPTFARAQVANGNARTGGMGGPTKPGLVSYELRDGNNDQIFVVQPQAGGAYEYRGNVHGGEALNGTPVAKAHNDDGWVTVTSELDQEGIFPARKFQWNWPTKITCTGDASHFVTVDHLFTAFPDGVTRCDRTTTFMRNTNLSGMFEWMSSYDLTTPRIGRIGRGSDVTNSIDAFTHAAIPAAPTVTTSATGGTLAAATYSYKVTALTPLGETLASTAGTVTTTGSTSKTTVTWSAVTNATGYRVYGRTGGVEALLTSVGPGTLTWDDTGSTGGTALPPREDTGRVRGSRAEVLPIGDDRATWACWYDPISGWAHGNIYDREAILTRVDGVSGGTVYLVSGSGIVKNYNTLNFSTSTVTIPSGTIWTATHWSMVWRPEDPDRFHREIAVRAASLTALKDVYPTT